MLRDDVQPVSVDDHVIEPPHVFVDHIEPKLPRPGAAHRRARTGRAGLAVGGPLLPAARSRATRTRAGSATGEAGTGDDLFARRYDDMIPAAYDVHERVRAMDEDGVWAELLFPTFPRFGGNRFLEADDKDLALACVQAWNDWMLDEWCAAYPDRFIPQTLIPLWDIRGSRSREIERCAAKGSKAIMFVENPYPIGLPSFPTGHWDPVFEAAADTGLPLSMHIGTSSGLLTPSPDDDAVGRHRAVRRQLDERARRPHLQRRAQGAARTARSRCPKAARAGCRTCSSASTTRGSAAATRACRLHAGCRRRCSRSTSGSAWSPTGTRSGTATSSALDKLMWECRLPAQRLELARTVARCWPTRCTTSPTTRRGGSASSTPASSTGSPRA